MKKIMLKNRRDAIRKIAEALKISYEHLKEHHRQTRTEAPDLFARRLF